MLNNDNYYLKDIAKKVGGKVGLRDNNNMLLKKIAEKIGQGGGGTVIVDDELDDSSVNPVENRVITNALSDKADVSSLNGKVDTSDLGELTITIQYIDSTSETVTLTKWSE